MKDLTVTQKRCLELARIIREGLPGVRFNMCITQNDCGTSGCIAGHAVAVYRPEIWRKGHVHSLQAVEILGLSKEEHEALFFPDRMLFVTPAMAAATLERFALTGKVEWLAAQAYSESNQCQ